MSYQTLRLEIITPNRDQDKKPIVEGIFLIHREGSPLILGSGRYAAVSLASSGANLTNATDFYAVKFLRRDPFSDVFSRMARWRFFEELAKTSELGSQGAAGPFVVFRGFSRLQDETSPTDATHFDENRIEDEYGELLHKTSRANAQTAFSKLSDNFKSEIQGDFFVMNAAFGTLDDLLTFQHSWQSHKIYSIPNSRLTRNLEELKEAKYNDIHAVLEQLKLAGKHGQPHSGFKILRSLSDSNKPLYYAVILGLFRRIVKSVALVHSQQVREEGHLAHRDLKPGNILIGGEVDHFSICLTDLGFVSGVEAIKRGVDTMPQSAKEPGVLAPGSYMFRAPEQIESGYEIFFNQVGPNKITIHCQREIKVDKGDWIECDDFKFENTDLNKTEVVEVTDPDDRNSNAITVRLRDPFETKLKKLYYHGYVNKLSGQHSDIFAVGSLLYYLVSGGKNPEKFYLKCLEEDGSSDDEDIRAIYECCFSISAMLCCHRDRERHVNSDLYSGRFKQKKDSDCEVINSVTQEPATTRRLKAGLGAIFKSGTVRSSDPVHLAEKRFLYAQSLRRSPSIAYFLKDAAGNAIPFPILFEIVKCMVRDKPDSYVRRESIKTESFFDCKLERKAEEIGRSVGEIQKWADFCKVTDMEKYSQITQDHAELLILLRLLQDSTSEKAENADDTAKQPPTSDKGDEPQPKIGAGIPNKRDITLIDGKS